MSPATHSLLILLIRLGKGIVTGYETWYKAREPTLDGAARKFHCDTIWHLRGALNACNAWLKKQPQPQP